MDAARAAQALVDASSSMIRSHDTTGALADLLGNCEVGLGVDASGILLETDGRLELLVASTHQATELEMHQLQDDDGPCVEAHATGHPVDEHSRESLVKRWPRFGPAMIDAGFLAVHAAPLRVDGSPVGAVGLFRRANTPFTSAEGAVAQAFADIASMLLIHVGAVEPQDVARRVREALAARTVIEQAKGVLADRHDLSMADAYARLLHDAREKGETLTEWADRVVTDAQTRR